MKKILPIILFMNLFAVSVVTAKRAQTVDDMWAMKRIQDIALSPDEQNIAFSVTEYNMENNTEQTDIWLCTAAGDNIRRLTKSPFNDISPQWLPDGSAILFLSDRNGAMQIYTLYLSGGEAGQITHLPVDIESFIISPNGNKFAFTATIFAETKSLQESAMLDQEKETSKVKAKIIDHLFFRYWDHWTDGKRTHIFICNADGSNVIDLTPGEYDAPPLDLGSIQDFVFSPDGRELAFVSNLDPMPAVTPNNDVFVVPVSGGKANKISGENTAVDNCPRYSPDGKLIVYKAMKRPGFESDQYEILLYNRETGSRISLTESFDRIPDEIIWSPDSKLIYFNAEDLGRKKIYSLDIKTGGIKTIVTEHFNTGINIGTSDKVLYFKQQAVNMPDEIFKVNSKNQIEQITFLNKPLLDQLVMNPVEDYWFDSFDGKKAHCLLLKPPFFDPDKKYPLIFLIHGGPQGMWSDDYHYRWNASMFAAPGYIVAMVNFRGSHGYGQDWCDLVSKDWGGGPYKDLMTGLDFILEKFSFIDKNKIAAAGASYGGYMVNWIATHNDRFRALVSHSGPFDLRSKYGATEELWFPEWELGGTPYENPELYEKWSPSFYVENMKKYKTPTLVIHGQYDYRVAVTQSFQMFTALQRMGVPSRLLYFPDESHFITKPQNAKLWWSEIFAWINKWINS
ncbi:S9 family peptidase [candidate division KSB1 bacterium]|nr:S9 family peptidase [candidate division KSB1 bacterium]